MSATPRTHAAFEDTVGLPHLRRLDALHRKMAAMERELTTAVPELLAALEASHNQLVLLACEDWTRTLDASRMESLGVTLKVSREAIAKAKGQL